MRVKPRISVPWGGGIDRATGLADDRPGWWQELKNLQPREQRVAARGGLQSAVEVLMTGAVVPEDIPFLGLFESEAKGVVVAFKANVANNVEVLRVSTQGFNPVSCGVWGTLGSAVPRPMVFGVDSFRKFFLAHDEQVYTDRLVTRYLDDTFALTTLQADLDGGGMADVKFRGVRSYLDRLAGWGYGAASDADRPEYVRLSQPNAPTDFRKEAYFIAGKRSTPVLCCEPMPGSMLVFKPQQTFEIVGSTSANFAINLIDPLYGLGGSHLSIVVAGRCYYWTLEGPRYRDAGQESVDLGVPLDLDGEMPSDLVDEGDRSYGFVEYKANKRVVAFNFPNRDAGKTRQYCLSVRDPANPRWFYQEPMRALFCSALLYDAPAGPPTGYPAIGALTATSDTVTVPWDNISAAGDETVEMWLQEDAGGFTKVREVAVAGASQTETLGVAEGVSAGHTYDVALRYRRGARYTADYDDPVDGGWGATPISQSVASVSTSSTPAAPTDPIYDACATYLYGGKTYMKVGFSWTNGIGSGTWRVYEAVDSTDFADAFLQRHGAITGATDRVDNYGNWLVSPSGAGTRTVWVVNRDTDGNDSDPLFVNTWTPADGCLL